VIEGRVGDHLIVRLKNELPEPTTIHWHGLRIPPLMDGTELTQPLVQPGETFLYDFVLPDAGTFWFHPHTNETGQLERGLYGALIVREEREEIVSDRERVFMLDDVKLQRNQIAPHGGFFERHNGRVGNVLLVNGKVQPTLAMRAGQTERWRFINGANARYVQLSLGGRSFSIIGSDGGLLEQAVRATHVLLAPGDRVELAVGPFQEGETITIESLPYDRRAGKPSAADFATVSVLPPCPTRAYLPEVLRDIPPLVSDAASATVTREVLLSGRFSLKRGVDFLSNGEMHHHAAPVKVGELQVWDIVNESQIDHPFHLHGFFFQVLSVNGAAPAYRSWEDTVNVPAKSRVRIGWLPDNRPGPWMYQCHILEHHAAGMMAHFELVP
jgi:FtsP/CotA-like multicopper oxidase with cupredoxin domain